MPIQRLVNTCLPASYDLSRMFRGGSPFLEDVLGRWSNSGQEKDHTQEGDRIDISAGELLNFADQNRKPHWELNAGMYSIEDESNPGFWGRYDVTGLEDALAYLTCFEGVQ